MFETFIATYVVAYILSFMQAYLRCFTYKCIYIVRSPLHARGFICTDSGVPVCALPSREGLTVQALLFYYTSVYMHVHICH